MNESEFLEFLEECNGNWKDRQYREHILREVQKMQHLSTMIADHTHNSREQLMLEASKRKTVIEIEKKYLESSTNGSYQYPRHIRAASASHESSDDSYNNSLDFDFYNLKAQNASRTKKKQIIQIDQKSNNNNNNNNNKTTTETGVAVTAVINSPTDIFKQPSKPLKPSHESKTIEGTSSLSKEDRSAAYRQTRQQHTENENKSNNTTGNTSVGMHSTNKGGTTTASQNKYLPASQVEIKAASMAQQHAQKNGNYMVKVNSTQKSTTTTIGGVGAAAAGAAILTAPTQAGMREAQLQKQQQQQQQQSPDVQIMQIEIEKRQQQQQQKIELLPKRSDADKIKGKIISDRDYQRQAVIAPGATSTTTTSNVAASQKPKSQNNSPSMKASRTSVPAGLLYNFQTMSQMNVNKQETNSYGMNTNVLGQLINLKSVSQQQKNSNNNNNNNNANSAQQARDGAISKNNSIQAIVPQRNGNSNEGSKHSHQQQQQQQQSQSSQQQQQVNLDLILARHQQSQQVNTAYHPAELVLSSIHKANQAAAAKIQTSQEQSSQYNNTSDNNYFSEDRMGQIEKAGKNYLQGGITADFVQGKHSNTSRSNSNNQLSTQQILSKQVSQQTQQTQQQQQYQLLNENALANSQTNNKQRKVVSHLNQQGSNQGSGNASSTLSQQTIVVPANLQQGFATHKHSAENIRIFDNENSDGSRFHDENITSLAAKGQCSTDSQRKSTTVRGKKTTTTPHGVNSESTDRLTASTHSMNQTSSIMIGSVPHSSLAQVTQNVGATAYKNKWIDFKKFNKFTKDSDKKYVTAVNNISNISDSIGFAGNNRNVYHNSMSPNGRLPSSSSTKKPSNHLTNYLSLSSAMNPNFQNPSSKNTYSSNIKSLQVAGAPNVSAGMSSQSLGQQQLNSLPVGQQQSQQNNNNNNVLRASTDQFNNQQMKSNRVSRDSAEKTHQQSSAIISNLSGVLPYQTQIMNNNHNNGQEASSLVGSVLLNSIGNADDSYQQKQIASAAAAAQLFSSKQQQQQQIMNKANSYKILEGNNYPGSSSTSYSVGDKQSHSFLKIPGGSANHGGVNSMSNIASNSSNANVTTAATSSVSAATSVINSSQIAKTTQNSNVPLSISQTILHNASNAAAAAAVATSATSSSKNNNTHSAALYQKSQTNVLLSKQGKHSGEGLLSSSANLNTLSTFGIPSNNNNNNLSSTGMGLRTTSVNLGQNRIAATPPGTTATATNSMGITAGQSGNATNGISSQRLNLNLNSYLTNQTGAGAGGTHSSNCKLAKKIDMQKVFNATSSNSFSVQQQSSSSSSQQHKDYLSVSSSSQLQTSTHAMQAQNLSIVLQKIIKNKNQQQTLQSQTQQSLKQPILSTIPSSSLSSQSQVNNINNTQQHGLSGSTPSGMRLMTPTPVQKQSSTPTPSQTKKNHSSVIKSPQFSSQIKKMYA